MNIERLKLYYFRVTDIWKRFCEEHTLLFNLTCDEYSALLKSDFDETERLTNAKEKVIVRIKALEEVRSNVLRDINNSELVEDRIESISELIELMKNYEAETNEKHLYRFNELLIDIIEKIQTQNKKNQLFINKAILSLREIREDAAGGGKKYSTYSAKGVSKARSAD